MAINQIIKDVPDNTVAVHNTAVFSLQYRCTAHLHKTSMNLCAEKTQLKMSRISNTNLKIIFKKSMLQCLYLGPASRTAVENFLVYFTCSFWFHK